MPEGNPFTLLAKSYREGRFDECLDIITNIYVYLTRRTPTRSLRKQWKDALYHTTETESELGVRFGGSDFTIKRCGPDGGHNYFIRIHDFGNGEVDAYLDYTTEGNAGFGIVGKNRLAVRGLQLIGYNIREPDGE